jgi:membrane-associated phospholipid phosphatase
VKAPPGSGDASAVTQAVLLALPPVIDALDVFLSHGDALEWVEDTIVMGQTMLISGAFTEIAKISFQRPRPVGYGLDPSDSNVNFPDTYQSFWSLAANLAFVNATSGAVTYALRHPDGPWRWVYLGAAYLAAGTFSVTRFVFGKHFPTDVIVGVLTGSLTGLAVPWLHRRKLPVTVGAAALPNGGGYVSVSAALPF